MSDERMRLLEREAWRTKSPEAWTRWAEESARALAGQLHGPVAPWEVPRVRAVLTRRGRVYESDTGRGHPALHRAAVDDMEALLLQVMLRREGPSA